MNEWQTTSRPYGKMGNRPAVPHRGELPLVLIESPFAGNESLHVEYARLALLDSLRRGEAPFASHLLYTQVLDDRKPEERHLGIEAGLAIGRLAVLSAFYVDLGMSRGMEIGLERAQREGRDIQYRHIKEFEHATIRSS